MADLSQAVWLAFELILSLDVDLAEIVALSLRVSLTAVALACIAGLPLGAFLAVTGMPGRNLLVSVINALMGLPPVVVGLIVYLMLSRSGPLGVFGLLYTPTAMIVAQTVLIAPIIAALTRQIIDDLNVEYDEYLRSLDLGMIRRLTTLIWDARASLTTAAIAGLGRAIARRLVEQHGGSLELDSEPGKGSTFYLLLPSPSQRPQRDEAADSSGAKDGADPAG